jgi:hypothetical protein
VGDVVYGLTNWQEWLVADGEHRFTVVPPGLGLDWYTIPLTDGVC